MGSSVICGCNRTVRNKDIVFGDNNTMTSDRYSIEHAKSAKVIQKAYYQNIISNKVLAKTIKENINKIIQNEITEDIFIKLIPENIKGILTQYEQTLKEKVHFSVTNKIAVKLNPLILTTGEIYYGEWNLNGEKHGRGILFFKSDCDNENNITFFYSGIFNHNQFENYGILINSNSEYYIGHWKNSLMHGNGKLYQPGKFLYNGSFKNGKKDGQGEEAYKDGSIYIGSFMDDERENEGTFKLADGSIYKGNFNKSLFEGFGEMAWTDGRTYKGYWKKGKMNGKGESTFPGGYLYVGEYINNTKSGRGRYFWGTEKCYEGQWLNNKPHGIGTFYRDNEIYNGVWRYGKLIRVNNYTKSTKGLAASIKLIQSSPNFYQVGDVNEDDFHLKHPGENIFILNDNNVDSY
jgi:hypothetical protein